MRRAIFSGFSLALVLWLLVASSGPARAQATTPTPTEPAGTATPNPSLGIVGGETWAAPANLSRSGAAQKPAVVADSNGNLHVLWWDTFAGTFYATYSPAAGWSDPLAVPQIIGARPTNATDKPTAYDELSLLADNNGLLHAFYRDSRGNLLYSQARADTGAWTTGVQLATNPLRWDAAVDPEGGLHLAFVRTIENSQLPAGVYYRRSTTRGANWENVKIIQASLYFRALTYANSFVDLTAPGQGQVLITWDDPRVGQSFTARSTDLGTTFGEPLAVGDDQADLPRHSFLLPLEDGRLMRLWSPPSNCNLYQQISDEAQENWSAPVRVLEDLAGCLFKVTSYTLPDGRLALFARLTEGPTELALVLWDGTRWSSPVTPRISFVDPATNRSTTLSCVAAVLDGEQVSVVGCDGTEDIWGTTSLVTLPDLLPAVSTEWSPPVIISLSDTNAGLPALGVDSDGRLHTLWTKGQLDGSTQETLSYARLEGDTWSSPNAVLASPGGGTAKDPVVVIDQGGHMHALWSGGPTGQLFYSRSFARDASTSGGWEAIRNLSGDQNSGGSPALTQGQNGELYIAYTVPLNEGRGVYFISSTNQGDSWSAPTVIFDAEQAGWAQVLQTAIARDAAGRLHVAWVHTALPPATNPLGVYYAWSDDDGQTWSAPRVMASGDAGYPTLVAGGDDEVHLLWVDNLTGDPHLWHARLPAGSDTWSEPKLVSGLLAIAPQVSVIPDDEGRLHLVGVEQTSSDSTVLFYLTWDGSRWGGRETIPLGYSVDRLSGARAVIRPQGILGVVYRVYALVSGGGRQYLAGYVERPVAALVFQPAPTFTPPPVATMEVTATVEATNTPQPTQDLHGTPPPPLNGDNGLRVGGILVGMAVVVIIALIGLRARRG